MLNLANFSVLFFFLDTPEAFLRLPPVVIDTGSRVDPVGSIGLGGRPKSDSLAVRLAMEYLVLPPAAEAANEAAARVAADTLDDFEID